MSLKLRLIPRPAFEVVAPDGTSLGEFKQDGAEWEGMLKLVSACRLDTLKCETLIGDRSGSGTFFDAFFSALNGDDHVEVDLIKASPSLIAALDEIEKRPKPTAPADVPPPGPS